ncbi:2-isopropylmalate synthase [Dissostichus eleginoides]|uniref:2-isopropylmalate synthase n=1 Tax=Dissostichus eleginoides TaxID=100907 RepID=A0AAD9CEA5_DISEL|nr:2-isopropylmalate synthase [Dissostichus eleginoides]
MINSPDSCPDANRNPVTQALRMTKWLLEYGSVSTQLPSCSFPFFNAPHCIGKRRPILTHISRALVSLGASPEDAAPIKAGLRRRVVTVSEGTRSKGIHWRRGLCVLQTGRGLFVNCVLKGPKS